MSDTKNGPDMSGSQTTKHPSTGVGCTNSATENAMVGPTEVVFPENTCRDMIDIHMDKDELSEGEFESDVDGSEPERSIAVHKRPANHDLSDSEGEGSQSSFKRRRSDETSLSDFKLQSSDSETDEAKVDLEAVQPELEGFFNPFAQANKNAWHLSDAQDSFV